MRKQRAWPGPSLLGMLHANSNKKVSNFNLFSFSFAFRYWHVCLLHHRLGALVIGWVSGSLLVPNIPALLLHPTWTLELLTSLVVCLFFFLPCTFLNSLITLSSPFIFTCYQQIVDENIPYNLPILIEFWVANPFFFLCMCVPWCTYLFFNLFMFQVHNYKKAELPSERFGGRIIFLKQLTNVYCPGIWIYGKRKGTYGPFGWRGKERKWKEIE